MGRTPKEDYVPLMVAIARRKLEAGEDVRIADIAAELEVSPSLVNFYFGDRQRLIDAAWRSLFEAYTADDLSEVSELARSEDWDGLRALVHRVFSPERDVVHLTHTRAAVEARRNAPLAELMAEVQDATIEQWRALLDRSAETGAVSTTLDHDAIARLVVAVPMGMGVVSPGLTDRQRCLIADAWFEMLRAVLDPAFHPAAARSDD